MNSYEECPREWPLTQLHFASLDVLRDIQKTCGGRYIVWPDEGGMGDKWIFNDEHAGKFEPLWVDPTTANLMVKVHDACKPANQEKMADWIAKSRAHFGKMVELSWDSVA